MSDRRSPVRVAIVGAGGTGRRHAHAAWRVGSLVAAVVDHHRPERAAALAARLPGRPAATAELAAAGLAATLHEHRIDVVHLCVPAEDRERLAQEAIAAGAHVLSGATVAPDAAGSERLFALAREQGLLLAPCHPFLHQPSVHSARQLLPSVGAVRQADLLIGVESEGGTSVPEGRREALALDALSHGLALVRRLLGRDLALATWHVCDGPAGELRIMSCTGLASVMVAVSMGARPVEQALVLRCMRGTVRVDLGHGFATTDRRRRGSIAGLASPFGGAARVLGAASVGLLRRSLGGERGSPGLRESIRQFHLAVQGRAQPPAEAEEVLDVARVRDLVRQRRPVLAP